MSHEKPATKQDVRQYWEENPLSSAVIPHEPGTSEYFEEHTRIRDAEANSKTTIWAFELNKANGKRVLDVGCGNGYVTCEFAEAGAEVTSVDITDKAVELTKARLAFRRLSADVNQGDAEALPFEDEAFDIVVSFGVIHHTPNTEQAVSELVRVLKPDGRLLLMLYHRSSFSYRILFPAKRLLQRSWRGKSAADQVNAVDGMENPLGKVYSKSEVRDLLRSVSNIEFMAGAMFFRWARLIPKPLRGMIERRWGFHLYIKATKPRQSSIPE